AREARPDDGQTEEGDAADTTAAAPAEDAPAAPASVDPAPAGPAAERELRLVVEGVVEHQGRVFETFRVRFRPEAPAAAQPVVLVVDRELRPSARYLLRLTLRDEVSGRVARLARALDVPAEPRPEDAAPVVEAARPVPLPGDVRATLTGPDHLLLVPPQEGVVLGLWRAEALVAGSGIVRVEFLVDGEVQLSRSRPPYTAELRLDPTPREQVIAVVGYGADGEVVARDEVVVNQPRGALRVRIVEPAPDARLDGRATVRAEVTVPAERRVDRLELSLNEEAFAVLERPPWEAEVELPPGDQPVVLTAAVWLDDGTRAEHVRVLNAAGYSEQLDVSLVELYVAAVDRQNRLVEGLVESDFRVLEDGRPQSVRRFEEVRDMPLVLGLVLDVSGSMQSTLADAERAATAFLRGVARPGDLSFALAFADHPMLLVPPTDDAEAVADALAGRQAFGGTALHDAVVTALYSFRGFEGQKALILFSDGDDTASDVSFSDALEYARRMNVSIYPIGFGVGRLDVPLRRKLDELATSTGGRSFYASDAGQLDAVYESIEAELRTRYLLAYAPERPAGEGEGDGDDGGFRRVEVEIARPGVSARTIRGYYP
ncbi:MAG TPA: VWA domain-containing protein, partial [Thermoanaerobaculia bacterium]|nr:VWA domain-containing protein [Thermoanaerobaculia bacterium]